MSKPKSRYSFQRLCTRLAILLGLTAIGLGGLSLTSKRPNNLGVVNGRLAECPASPNCVASQTESAAHKMAAMSFSGGSQEVLDKLKQIMAEMFPRARLVNYEDRYLRYEFTSFMFRFVDDIEFLIDDETKQIHFRSASRIGHSDLGVNRRRMIKLIEEFNR